VTPAQTSRVEAAIEKQRKWYYRKNTLRSVFAIWRLAKNPKATRYVFMIGDSQDNICESERRRGGFTDPFRKNPALEAMWQARFHAPVYDLEELGRLPADTLGGAYARHMKANDLRADYYDVKVTPRNRMQFLRQRMRQTHDIWHVLSGWGTDEFEEVGIQGFTAGQYMSSMAAIIGAAAFLKSIVRCRFNELERHVDNFCEGYGAGKRAENLLAVKWEELWGESLESLRRRYRIEPAHRAAVAPVRELRAAA
jgi:ubiquinone biosynthesis protein Coq4